MSKYTFVLYHKRQEEFLERLQELGLVDITTTGWEPDDREREMVISLEQHRAAQLRFKEMTTERKADGAGSPSAEPFATGEEAFERYLEASSRIDSLEGRIEKARKEEEDLRIWGDFSPAALESLAREGVVLRFFSVYTSDYDKLTGKYGGELLIQKITEHDGHTYFVVVQTGQADIPFDAQEYRQPDMTAADKAGLIAGLEEELGEWNAVMERACASAGLIAEHGRLVGDELEFSKAAGSGQREAEDTLVVMEGWATRESSPEVDLLLDSYPDVVYFKDRPAPHDNTPVVLKNNKFANAFEVIGSFYSLPRYGTLDLTAFFGPFYMIFFGFCLGDAGYGLVLFLASFFLRHKGMKQIANLTLLCGGASILFGFLVGSFFGIDLGGVAMFQSIQHRFLQTENLFYVALGLGVVQIIFGLVLNIVNKTRQFGFKYSLGTLGWLAVLTSTLCALLLPGLGVNFSFRSPVYLALLIAGLVLMLLFHNPDKNPLKNIGSGLWNTYNDVTGFLGDFLSYIRLFALCLSGGTLAIVFNDLALGLAPDIPVLRQLIVVIILLFGHSINLFMSALGAFVHPMRLTFVEFYKNAGFEATQREFSPFRRNQRTRSGETVTETEINTK